MRTKARYQAVQELKAQGKGIKAIMRELRLAKETVRKFYRAAGVDELLATPRAGRRSILDNFKPYLHERFTAGHTNVYGAAPRDHRPGLPRQLQRPPRLPRATARHRPGTDPGPVVPKVRQITSWLLRHPDDLDDDERLTTWMTVVETDDLPHLHRFVRGIRTDLDAVINGLTLSHSSGAVEGDVNRIKVLKRQTYGRAKFDLLRARILHAA